ncbi:hypothetical protein D3C87_125840 [compost metagenome]
MVSHILNSLLVIFLGSPGVASPIICTQGKVTKVEFGIVKNEALEFCTNSDKNVFLSKSCRDKKCTAFQKNKKYALSEVMSPMGNPGFKMCRLLGGEPEIIEFYVKKVPYKLDRCFFKNGDFADTSSLMEFHLQRPAAAN